MYGIKIKNKNRHRIISNSNEDNVLYHTDNLQVERTNRNNTQSYTHVFFKPCSHEHSNVGLGALYRPLILHMLPATVHCMVVNALKRTRHLKPSILGSSKNLNFRVTNQLGVCLRTPALSLGILLPSASVFLLFIYAG
jgi:hypothetical protein